MLGAVVSLGLVALTGPAQGAGSGPLCRAGDLAGAIVDVQGGAGSQFGRLILVNKSTHTCHTKGFIGGQFVGTDNHDITTHVTRDHSTPAKTVVVKAGAAAALAVALEPRPERVDAVQEGTLAARHPARRHRHPARLLQQHALPRRPRGTRDHRPPVGQQLADAHERVRALRVVATSSALCSSLRSTQSRAKSGSLPNSMWRAIRAPRAWTRPARRTRSRRAGRARGATGPRRPAGSCPR